MFAIDTTTSPLGCPELSIDKKLIQKCLKASHHKLYIRLVV